jgi:hypothetical protein
VQSLTPGFERGVPTELSTGLGDNKTVTLSFDSAKMRPSASKWPTVTGTLQTHFHTGWYDTFRLPIQSNREVKPYIDCHRSESASGGQRNDDADVKRRTPLVSNLSYSGLRRVIEREIHWPNPADRDDRRLGMATYDAVIVRSSGNPPYETAG